MSAPFTKNSIRLWHLAIMAILFTSCKFTEPTIGDFNLRNFKPKSGNEYIIEVAVEVDNPNNYNIWLKKGRFDILMNGTKMGTGKTQGTVVLKKRKKDYYTITVLANLDPGSALMGMITGIGGGGNKPITVKGDMKAGVFIFGQRFDVEFDDRLPSLNLFGG